MAEPKSWTSGFGALAAGIGTLLAGVAAFVGLWPKNDGAQPTVTPPAVQQVVQTPPVTTSAVTNAAQTAAPAQISYEMRQRFAELVRRNLDSQHKPVTDAGFAPDMGWQDRIDALELGRPSTFAVDLVKGAAYQIVAACDADCKDLDLEVFDQSGQSVGKDVLADDYPRVGLEPAYTGDFSVKVWVHTCERQPCFVGVRVLRR